MIHRTHTLLVVSLLLVLTTLNASASNTDPEASRLLASELPTGTVLQVASPGQVIAAARRAVRREPRRTVAVVHAAILYKISRRPVENKNVVDRSKEIICPPCDFVVGVARAAIQANTEAANAIIEEAGSICPGCVGDLAALLTDPGLALGGADEFSSGLFGFGVGLGPGFPGAPPPVNLPTGDILSLPPIGSPVTSVANN